MVAILGRIVAWAVTSGVGKFVLDYALDKLVKLFTGLTDMHTAAKDAKAKAVASAQAVKDAKTEEERKNAIKNNLGL